ncbi:MAG: gamma-glutamylcyclotransferase [Caulobacteraceae bacterium]
MSGLSADHWVFGYGSLMWRPGFTYVERAAAILHGRRRAFCIYSVHHRGRPGQPGLVLGLAAGGAVRGVAYRVAADDWAETHAYLIEREQPTETYIEASAQVRLEDGRTVQSLVFLSDTSHPQWAGRLHMDEQAALIARSCGVSGRNIDYLRDLVAHLRAQGTHDAGMEALLEKAEALNHAEMVRSAA